MNTYKQAMEFRRKIGKITLPKIENYIESQGWELVYYVSDDPIIQALKLTKLANVPESFVYSLRGKKIVGISNDVPTSRRLSLLLHEIGHILGDHVRDGGLNLPSVVQEAEAHEFSFYVMRRGAACGKLRAIIAALLLVFSLTYVTIDATAKVSAEVYTPSAVNRQSMPNTHQNITVVVTRAGEKYHKADCRYVEGKIDVQEIALADAEEKGYEPCSVCFD